jgi:hypothetical protein
VEYFLDRNLAGFLRVQMGPFVAFSTGYTDFVLLSLLGVAYRL